MLVAFFESIKHVGHIYPIALLRIYLGYVYFSNALERAQGEFLNQPRLAATIMESIPGRDLSVWYRDILENIVVPNWQIFAYVIVYIEAAIGISFLLGFLVRPSALFGIFLAANAIFVADVALVPMQQAYLALFIVLFWIGAGRCFGLDFYFYKRQRGLWW